MKQIDKSDSQIELEKLCNTVRTLIEHKEFKKCELLILKAMEKYPHAPQPHNLIGILLEMEGDHLTAMKHFRAAWALDPSYIPARYNMELFLSFSPKGQFAFDETDCPIE